MQDPTTPRDLSSPSDNSSTACFQFENLCDNGKELPAFARYGGCFGKTRYDTNIRFSKVRSPPCDVRPHFEKPEAFSSPRKPCRIAFFDQHQD